MNDGSSNIRFQEAKSAYKKFIRDSKGPFGLRLFEKKTQLKKFVDIQKELHAYNSSFLGIKTVEISQIVGSVQKYTDFDKNFVPQNSIIEARWCNIYIAFLGDANLPLVQLYKIKDEYFVYDGNHRISVANFLNFKSIEAEVTEFIPSSQNKEDVIYREKFLFEKETDIEGIIFSEVHQFGRIKKEIKDFRKYLKEKEGKEKTKKESAQIWYNSLYKPSIEILEYNNITDYFRERTLSDIFLYFLDHKYYRSEEKNADVGYTFAIVDFINLMKSHADKALNNRLLAGNETVKELQKLKALDKRIEYEREIIVKLDILEEVTGINFEHNFVILHEIDKYIVANDYSNYKEAVENWLDEKLLNHIAELKYRAKVLPQKYLDRIDEITENNELIFYQFRNYEEVYEKKYKSKTQELIPNYILDIFIPLTELIEQNFSQSINFSEIYNGIYGKYLYLFEYNRNVSLSRAAELYISDEGIKHYKTTEWFGISYNNVGKLERTILTALDKMENSVSVFFKKLISNYGKLGRYETLFKLEEYYNLLLEDFGDIAEVEEKISSDLKKMYMQNEVNIFYKTKTVLLEVQSGDSYSFLDYYISILESVSQLKKDRIYIDIIDLALDYIRR